MSDHMQIHFSLVSIGSCFSIIEVSDSIQSGGQLVFIIIATVWGGQHTVGNCMMSNVLKYIYILEVM